MPTQPALEITPVNLHTFSHFSFLEGQASQQDLASTAAAAGQPALALTDRHRLTGAVQFVDACEQHSIKPILGLTLTIAHRGSPSPHSFRDLVLLSTDRQGWSSLCALCSMVNDLEEATSEPHLPLTSLEQHADGLLCLSGNYLSETRGFGSVKMHPQAHLRLDSLKSIFGDRLYVQIDHILHSPSLMHSLSDLATESGIPPVATSATYFLDEKDHPLQSLLTAMRRNTREDQLHFELVPPQRAFFNNGEQLAELYKGFPEALNNISEVVERCILQLPLGEVQFPILALANDETADDHLRRLAFNGAKERYEEITPEIEERLEHELASISDQGYAPLFLIMADVLQYAHEADVPSGSRGSASSSLVAHCLGITSPDPLRLDLYFERFLNPARHSPPDIDVDLSSSRRDQVLEYVYERYGHDHVAMVSTITRLRTRSALRETAKAFGLTSAQIKRLVESLPHRGWGPNRGARNRTGGPYSKLREQYPDYGSLFDAAETLRGRPSHQSVHPGGIVISPGPIREIVPTLRASKGLITTQFDLEDIERIGLVKLDLLGIRSLAVLGWVADHLYKYGKSSYERQVTFIDAIPDEDEATTRLVESTNTIGCFQIESEGMRGTLREIQVSNRDEIMAALALFRPGPMTGGLKDAYVRRHLGKEEVQYLHPALAPLLVDTYGVILYQEQVLKIAHELAGLSLADADLLRRAMSHFDPGEQMKTLKLRFISGAEDKSGVPPAIGERIWELMAAFAGYGFPKAHAAAYAEIAWKSAYVKAHWPAEFMAGVMANWGGYYRQPSYIKETQRLGFEVRAPHVDHSQRQFTVTYLDDTPVLFMGLDQVKDLTHHTQKAILKKRPFHSLDDFLSRVAPRTLELEHLAKIGALSGYATIPGLLTRVARKDWQAGQPGLFQITSDDTEQDWQEAQIADAQQELLGIALV
ncbi:MAG: DNA polymerase III subunit alpha [Chloroflexi bacterium]|nr:MAG: DNA polymerase III subunit alpha [Chloroflexota bacterium]MBL1195170.1 DNA polymerase III subunit alpha [Chloroflexota bacterium]NOH12454.1 DNA polymerase III subunit alpha [Chloroflexota bacterium]